jgi:hypothetical protein
LFSNLPVIWIRLSYFCPDWPEFPVVLEQRLHMSTEFLRRRQAADYLLTKYGFGAAATLAKGVVTGDSPEYRKAGRMVVYTTQALDEWALTKIGPPRKSSSDKPEGAAKGAEAAMA